VRTPANDVEVHIAPHEDELDGKDTKECKNDEVMADGEP
jgi:hypothetical protein